MREQKNKYRTKSSCILEPDFQSFEKVLSRKMQEIQDSGNTILDVKYSIMCDRESDFYSAIILYLDNNSIYKIGECICKK